MPQLKECVTRIVISKDAPKNPANNLIKECKGAIIVQKKVS